MKPFKLKKDLTGSRFKKLLVIGLDHLASRSTGRIVFYLCQCDCGRNTVLPAGRLTSGHTLSCGCLRMRHGYSRTGKVHPIYNSWRGIIQRCTNPKHHAWKNYGGRGITVCKRWLRFENFRDDMEAAYRPCLMIERKNNSAGYSPQNCTWATIVEQNRNRRSNRVIEWAGQRRPVSSWAEKTGINNETIYYRLNNGWSVETSLTIRP